MLVFIDESYHPAGTQNPKSTFSAVLVEEERYREFDIKLFDLKRHFWKLGTPYELELKGRELLKERALRLPKNRDFVDQLIYLCKEVNLVLFAVVQQGTFPLASDSNRLPNLYRALMKRVNTYMEQKHQEEQAKFFFDGIDHESNRKIAISFNNFMYRHFAGRSFKNILPTTFFCDSEVTPGIQVADVLAYCVNQRYGGRTDLEEYFKRFRELSYNHQDLDEEYTLWGFSQVRGEEASPNFFATSTATMTLREEVLEAREEIKTETGDPEDPRH